MKKVVDAVVDTEKSSTTKNGAVGDRLKQARAACGLTQKGFCEVIGMPMPSLRDYELGKRIPGGDAITSMIRAGINANWLLTGEGPMLLADLVPPVVKPVARKINVDALEAIIEGALKMSPRLSASRIAAHSAGLYVRCIEEGMITEEDIGSGNLNDAA